jgi:hypothetical protein
MLASVPGPIHLDLTAEIEPPDSYIKQPNKDQALDSCVDIIEVVHYLNDPKKCLSIL